MKKQEENKTENCTLVNGVMLTEAAVDFIKSLQHENNSYLKEVCEELNTTISMLIDVLNDPDDAAAIVEQIKYLNTFSKNFKSLMKP